MKYYQQGDVLIKQVNYKIKGEKLNHMTLAEGEATGHHHSIVSGIGQLIMMNNIMHLQVFSGTALLKHQEHSMREKIKLYGCKENIPKEDIVYLRNMENIDFDNLTFDEIVAKTRNETIIPKGDYKIEIVRDFDHFENEAREVRD